jgi:tetratricopeptide (TPR) repeat protein
LHPKPIIVRVASRSPGKTGKLLAMSDPDATAVRAQLERLCSQRFRGVKAKRLLTFLVEEWLAGRSEKLTLEYIGESLKDEPLTFEDDSDRWGYPKTRANLAHVRNRLQSYYETKGYRDPVVVKLNLGSFAPVIASNAVIGNVPDLEPAVARLVLRAKTALDLRTLRGAWRALAYYTQIPLNLANSRQAANSVFIPMAAASIVPSATSAIRPLIDVAIAHIKQSGIEPWESMFTEACGKACYEHQWKESLDLFDLAIVASQGQARYYWWYTALLASLGKARQAIEILDRAVQHFCRTNIATRTDLALLQVMIGCYDEAEETLLGCLDFAALDNPVIVYSQAVLYEAQGRLEDAVRPLMLIYSDVPQDLDTLSTDEALARRDLHALVNGMFVLVMGHLGATGIASRLLDTLLACKAKRSAASSLEIAVAFIGLRRHDEAVIWLNKAAFEEGDPFAMWFHIFPPLRHLHGHAGFRKLLAKLKLPSQRPL